MMAEDRTRRARVVSAALGAVVVLATLPFLAVAPAAASVTPSADPAPGTAIAAGPDSSCVIVTGAVSCWGYNGNGELGNGTTKDSPVPVPVTTAGTPLAGATVTQVAVGDGVACALTSAGAVACWGGDSFSKVGNLFQTKSLVPVPVDTSGVLSGKTVTQITAKGWAVCVLTSDGTIVCWGYNGNGQIGDGTTTSRSLPVAVAVAGTPLAGKTIASIDAGNDHVCAVATDGTIGCWGSNISGQLGNGTTTNSSVPVSPTVAGTALAGKVPVEVAAGYSHTCARSSDGSVACWGSGSSGALGRGSTASSNVAVPVTVTGTALEGQTVAALDASSGSTCARLASGSLACWGSNVSGQLGIGTTAANSTVAVAPLSGDSVTEIAMGTLHVCARSADGSVACWGENHYGEVGNGVTGVARVPAAAVGGVLTGASVAEIEGGMHNVCARTSAGSVACWGDGASRQNGTSSTADALVPVSVEVGSSPLASSPAVDLAVGTSHACALSSNSAITCWGSNSSKQLGRSASTSAPDVVATAGTPLAGKDVAEIVAGSSTTCARTTDGAVACWGANAVGQLGNGSTAVSAAPVALTTAGTVLDGKTITDLAYGSAQGCALASDSTVACWGDNTFGTLGNGTEADSLTPVGVIRSGTPLEGKTIVSIEGGESSTMCAVTSDGASACWGEGSYGSHGSGMFSHSTVPQAVVTASTPLAGTSILQASPGYIHTCWLGSSSALACAGNNAGLGDGGGSDDVNKPTAVVTAGTPLAGKTIAQVTSVGSGSCARTTDSVISCWGLNWDGELGNGTPAIEITPRAVVGLSPSGATVPGAPTIGVATAATGAVSLFWTAPASNGGSAITGYQITPYLGGVAQPVVTSAGTGTSKTVTGLTNGATYTFKVAASNVAGTGPQSAASNPATPAAAPGAPTDVTVAPGNGQVTVGWTAPASNGGGAITSYTVRPYIGGVAQTPVTSSGSGTSKVVTGLANGTAYTFKVAASNAAGGTGLSSAASSVVTPRTTPGGPSQVTGSPGDGQITVSWTAPSSDGGSPVTGYVVTPYIGATAQTPVASSGTGTSKAVTGLTNGTAYTFRVNAVNAAGNGPLSPASAAVTPTAAATAPGAPTAVSGVAGDGQVTLAWTAPVSDGGSPITGYVIVRYVNGDVAGQTMANGTATSKVVTGLVNGVAYTFKVAAVNGVGQGPMSEASAAVTPSAAPTAPGAPVIGTATPGDATVTLTWTAPVADGGSAITGYVITPYIGAAAQAPVVSSGTGTSKVVTGLANGTAYTFTVAAVNAIGTGAPSAASSAVTPKAPFAPFGSWGAFVDRVYVDLTAAAPTASERSSWVAQLTAGTKTKGDLVAALRLSTDNVTRVDSTVRLYRALLGRAPDAGGLKFWIGRRRSGNWTLNKMATSFSSSSEFKRKYGSLSNQAFVTQIYTDVLGRDADPGGVAYWTGKLDSGSRTRGTVMVGFSESNEYKRKQAENTDVAVAYIFLLGRVPTADETTGWTTRQKAGTTGAVLAEELLDSPAYAAHIAGS